MKNSWGKTWGQVIDENYDDDDEDDKVINENYDDDDNGDEEGDRG